MKKRKKKSVYLTIRKKAPPTGGPMKSKKQKEKEKRIKGKILLKKIQKDYS